MVPPRETTSAPMSVVISRSSQSSEAAALASREPSTWSSSPCARACSPRAASSSTCVQGAELGRLRDRDDPGLDDVLVADPHDPPVHELGGELAVGRRDGQQLDPGEGLGRAALVDVQVRALGADHALPRAQHRAQADDVGARAVEDREGGGMLAEDGFDVGLQPRGGLVGAVGGGVAVVDGGDGVQRLGQDGGVVVAREGSHARTTIAMDDPLRMYIVIRRGAFETIDEGGRLAGLAAVRVLAEFAGDPAVEAGCPGPGRSSCGRAARRNGRGCSRSRTRRRRTASSRCPPRRRSERGDALTKIQAMSTELEAPPRAVRCGARLRAEPGDRDELRQDAGPDRPRRGDGGAAGPRRLPRARDRAADASTCPAAWPRCATRA